MKLEKCQIKEDKVEIRMEYGDYRPTRIITEQNFSQARWMRQKKRDMIFRFLCHSKGNEVSVEDAVKGVKHVRVISLRGAAGNRNEDPVLCVSGTAVIKGKHGGYGRRVDHKVHRECFCVIIRAD